jgi:hypothetical protein
MLLYRMRMASERSLAFRLLARSLTAEHLRVFSLGRGPFESGLAWRCGVAVLSASEGQQTIFFENPRASTSQMSVHWLQNAATSKTRRDFVGSFEASVARVA